MSVEGFSEVTGDIQPVGVEEEEEGTLDEPISVTLKRDLKAIVRKCAHVVVPVRSNKALLHDWDLWGPLLLCITMAMLLHGRSHDQSSAETHTIHFIEVFLLVWGGAGVVTINAQLLRGKVSFFQSVCTLGYCLLPLAVALLVSRLLLLDSHHPRLIFALRLGTIGVALVWAIWASVGFLADYLPHDRKSLAVYPIILFYFGISCLIVAQNNALL